MERWGYHFFLFLLSLLPSALSLVLCPFRFCGSLYRLWVCVVRSHISPQYFFFPVSVVRCGLASGLLYFPRPCCFSIYTALFLCLAEGVDVVVCGYDSSVPQRDVLLFSFPRLAGVPETALLVATTPSSLRRPATVAPQFFYATPHSPLSSSFLFLPFPKSCSSLADGFFVFDLLFCFFPPRSA